VQTLGKPPLKTNGLAAGYVPNCEGWVRGALAYFQALALPAAGAMHSLTFLASCLTV
jgi:hypothetical protein